MADVLERPESLLGPFPEAGSSRSVRHLGPVPGVGVFGEVVFGQAAVGVVVAGDRGDQLGQAFVGSVVAGRARRVLVVAFQVPVVAAEVRSQMTYRPSSSGLLTHLRPQPPVVHHGVVPLAEQRGVVDVGGATVGPVQHVMGPAQEAGAAHPG